VTAPRKFIQPTGDGQIQVNAGYCDAQAPDSRVALVVCRKCGFIAWLGEDAMQAMLKKSNHKLYAAGYAEPGKRIALGIDVEL
jgi:hypothetical protein